MTWNIVGVPVDCLGAEPGGAAFGTELSPRALRELGVVERVRGKDRGDILTRVVGSERDPVTRLVGGRSVHDVVAKTRASVRGLVADGQVLVLGGCCIPLMGALAGARDVRGDVGLVYIDGHLDLYDHNTSPTGEAADMPTAAVLGIGEPGLLAAIGAPVVDPSSVAILGPRDLDEPATVGHIVDALDLQVTGPEQINADPEGVLRSAVDRAGGASGGYWLHLDVDVFSESEFPATDYLMPGGLTLATGRAMLAAVAGDDHLVGLSVGCYNPEKDIGGAYGRELVNLLHVACAEL